MDQPIPNDLVSAPRAATLLGVNPATVIRWIRRGKLRAWTRAGTRYVVSLADVRALLQPVRPQRAKKPESQREEKARELWETQVLREAGVL